MVSWGAQSRGCVVSISDSLRPVWQLGSLRLNTGPLESTVTLSSREGSLQTSFGKCHQGGIDGVFPGQNPVVNPRGNLKDCLLLHPCGPYLSPESTGDPVTEAVWRVCVIYVDSACMCHVCTYSVIVCVKCGQCTHG